MFVQRVTPHVQQLIHAGSQAMAKQFLASKKEEYRAPWQHDSPIGGVKDEVIPGLIQHYTHKALLITTPHCAAHCRFCFRRSSPQRVASVTEKQVEDIATYLATQPQIQELLFSGGDPLTLPLHTLALYFDMIRAHRKDILFRYCTRLPVVDPLALTPAHISLLGKQAPGVMVLHINHPDELSTELVSLVYKLQQAGVPVWSQTVLLKSVNDRALVLEKLFVQLQALHIQPHYLFQLDLAPGTAHFQVDLRRGIALAKQLTERLHAQHLTAPPYAIDVPYKGGKVNLLHAKVSLAEDESLYKVEAPACQGLGHGSKYGSGHGSGWGLQYGLGHNVESALQNTPKPCIHQFTYPR